MKEPKGIILEAEISEKAVRKFFNHKLPTLADQEGYPSGLNNPRSVMEFFTQALYRCENGTKGIFLLNYEAEKELFFCAYILKDYQEVLIAPFIEALKHFSTYKDRESLNYAVVTSIVPEADFGFSIATNHIAKVPADKLKRETIHSLLNKFWTFKVKNDFPEPEKAFRRKNYFYKPFQNAYKKYLKQQEEIEKPLKISKATKENPYHLFENFYSYDHRVFEFDSFTKAIVELPHADPLTFTALGTALKDKNHVYSKKIVGNTAQVASMELILSAKTIWGYKIIPGVDAQTFTYVKARWDTLYWKDKKHVYFEVHENGYPDYQKIETADVKTFEYLGFCFGKDKAYVFYKGDIIAIDPKNFTLNESGFMIDEKNIYHYENKLALDPASFKIISLESEQNPFMGKFILEDKNGQYVYEQNLGLKLLLS